MVVSGIDVDTIAWREDTAVGAMERDSSHPRDRSKVDVSETKRRFQQIEEDHEDLFAAALEKVGYPEN